MSVGSEEGLGEVRPRLVFGATGDTSSYASRCDVCIDYCTLAGSRPMLRRRSPMLGTIVGAGNAER
jgi:hypothetical protein